MNNNYNPHLLEWTDEKVSRFWEFYNNYKPFDGSWFTEVAGPAIIKITNKNVPIHNRVLDYGTGQGFLLNHLIKQTPNIDLYACDFTPTLVKETNEKYKDVPQFKGCLQIDSLPSKYEDNFFDFVFVIETIEHLTDKYVNSTFQEIQRILKSGGTVVITTPNEEMLEKHHVHCADCGATFHHMQHIRSWNSTKLQDLAKQFGLTTVWCEAVNLDWYKKRSFFPGVFNAIRKSFYKGTNPNLFFIGKKV